MTTGLFTGAEIAEMREKFPSYRDPCTICEERDVCWGTCCFPPKTWDAVHHPWLCHRCRVESFGEHRHHYRLACACGATKDLAA